MDAIVHERHRDAEIEVLKGKRTMPTMLPGSSFFLGMPYGRARDYISAGLGVALASDYNPGSSPSGDMRFVMALGCIKMRLTPEQAFNACTLNSAYFTMPAKDVTLKAIYEEIPTYTVTYKVVNGTWSDDSSMTLALLAKW